MPGCPVEYLQQAGTRAQPVAAIALASLDVSAAVLAHVGPRSHAEGGGVVMLRREGDADGSHGLAPLCYVAPACKPAVTSHIVWVACDTPTPAGVQCAREKDPS